MMIPVDSRFLAMLQDCLTIGNFEIYNNSVVNSNFSPCSAKHAGDQTPVCRDAAGDSLKPPGSKMKLKLY
jgi:hypothetical protein